MDQVREYLRVAKGSPGLSEADNTKAYNQAILLAAINLRRQARQKVP